MKEWRVGIGFATGRKNFKRVLLSYLRTWEATKRNLPEYKKIRIHLFVSYDVGYRDTKSTDYTNLPQEIIDTFDSVTFVGEKNSLRSLEKIRESGRYRQEDLENLFGSGYAAKRNEVLFAALENKMDCLLFIDDDEYPMAVTENREVCLWSGQQVITSHLKEIMHADYTHGYHCGYISPIPQIQFGTMLPEKVFRLFVEAISNDIVNWEDMKHIIARGGITYASTKVLIEQKAQEVELKGGCKFISGANLCINLTSPQRTFPFFNPPGARGEDTFLSTLLGDRKVVRIPCYTFHDGFSAYQHLLEGSLPIHLTPITAETRGVTERFLNACLGWVRYKPLLVFVTDPEGYPARMEKTGKALAEVLPFMAEYFKESRFLQVQDEFRAYAEKAEEHYRLFLKAQETWADIVSGLL